MVAGARISYCPSLAQSLNEIWCSETNLHYSLPLYSFYFMYALSLNYGPGSSVSRATDYWLDGPESNPGGDEIFRQSGPALGPTQPTVKWAPSLSRG